MNCDICNKKIHRIKPGPTEPTLFICSNCNNIHNPNKDTLLVIFKEEPRVISENKIWVCFVKGYMYLGDTLEDLYTQMRNEWQADKHIVG